MTDDIYTIQLPCSDLQFTRYLYIKEEVRIALLLSILNKNDDAIFWAYELYHSGFKHELLNLIWKIYYDFFATLNPSFEQYLLKKQKELLNNKDDRILSTIIQTLLFRPFNTDIWAARTISQRFIIDIDYADCTNILTRGDTIRANMTKWIANNDFRSIIQWIYNENNADPETYNICLDIFNIKSKPRLIKLFQSIITTGNTNIDVKTILFAKIMTLFTKKKEKSIYVNVEPEDIIHYETITGVERANNILEKVYSQCGGIDYFHCLSLFKLTRDKYKDNLENIYRQNWEYHASFAPIWSQRIREFGGYVDYVNKKVVFKEDPDDDLMQEFYTRYGLEPDEQKKEIQEKSIGKIVSKYDWKWFSEKYRGSGLIDIYDEELDDFDQDNLTY